MVSEGAGNMDIQKNYRTIPRVLIVLFLLLVLGLIFAGTRFYNAQKERVKSEVHNNLTTIADLKVWQILKWREDQVNYAEFVFDNNLFASQVDEYFRNPDRISSKQKLFFEMESFKNHFGYESILLVSTKGSVSIAISPHGDTVGTHAQYLFAEALRRRKVIFSDLHISEALPVIHLDVAVPILSPNRNGNTVIGIIFVRIDPNKVLFPLIQRWPAPSRTAETILLERSGDSVLYLNELRHQKNTALRLRLPLSNELLPASMAVRGIEGMIEGIDYRGVQVLAAIRHISNSPWYIIAKIDQDEVYAPLQSQVFTISLMIFFIVLSIGVLIGFWWRHQRAKFYRKQYEAEVERKALVTHFDHIIKYANDIFLLTNMEGRIVEANDQACRSYGYAREEIIRLNLRDLRTTDSGSQSEMQMNRVEKEDGLVFESEHRKKDGTLFPVEISSRFIKIDGKRFFQSIIRDITERKQAEGLLKEAYTRYQRLQVNIPGMIYIYALHSDGSFSFPFVSSISKLFFNIDPEEIMHDGRLLTDLIHPDDRKRRDESIQRSAKTMQPWREELRHIVNGRVRWFDCMSRPELQSNGDVFWDGIMFEITERKQAEDALRENEALFKTLVDSSPVAIAVFSTTTSTIEYVSRRFMELFGYGPEDIPSIDAWWKIAYPIDNYREQIAAMWHKTVEVAQNEGHKDKSIESFITCKDGSTKYIESTIATTGRQTLIFCTDLTQRRSAEEALRQTNAFNDLLIQTMPFGMNIVDEDGNILFVSKAMKEMLTVDVLDMCCWKVYKDDNEQCKECPLHRGIAFGKPEVLEVSGILGGRTFQISHIGMMYQGRKAMMEVFQDITEQKKLQQELTQSQKLLSIGTMAGGIAHDFNNILGIIIGYTSILQSNKTNPEKFSEGINAIKQTVDRGAGLVRQILTFARKTDISFEPLSVPDLVKEIVSMLQQTFPKIITFKTSFEESLPYINADHSQMHQALLNLCVNARDAMPDGGEISVHTKVVNLQDLKSRFSSANNEWYICLNISDTGTGIDESVRSQIFDPFFTTKDKGKGTGLGLSVVYGIVQAHNGFIDVVSAVGSGTTFCLYFPVPIESIDPQNSQEKEKEQIVGGTETILVVEDETLLLDMMQVLLESNGYTVFTAKDGEEAVNIYARHAKEIDLVITDMGLPKLTGIAEFEKLKGIRPDVKIIFASGYFEPDSKAALESAGAKGFLQKPYVIEDALIKIRRALE
jgi:two-component system, cell cycle sensor histidine kinase and response regulator CckA